MYMNHQITVTIEDRRETDLTPIVERRGGEAQRMPRWLQRARDGALYGYDENGTPVAGKVMSA
jgi:hypothetical protein